MGGRWRSRAVAGAAALLLVANCTGGDDPDTPSGATVPVGELRLGLPGTPVVDPASASLAEPAELLTIDLLYDGLTRLDAAGSVQPALAERWEADPDQRTWRFHLTPGSTFSSGRAITATDVVTSLEALAKGGDGSLAALRLEPVTGFRAFVDGEADRMEGLRAPDPATVEIALDGPLSTLPVLLAAPSYGVVDVASLTAVADDPGRLADLELSGPWSVGSVADGGLTLARRGDGAGPTTVSLRAFEDVDAAFEAFEEGQLDWAEVPDPDVPDAIDRYGDEAFTPFHAELFLGLNVRSGALADLAVRAAVANAVDRAAIVQAVYPDVALPLGGIVPAGVAGAVAPGCSSCGFDPARARAVLAERFGEAPRPTLAIDYDDSPAQEAVARILARDLEAVGFTTELRSHSMTEYQDLVVAGGQEVFSFGWVGAYGSPDAYLAPLFGSGSPDNLLGYRDADVDGLLAQARAQPLGPTTAGWWGVVERRVLETAVAVPLAQFRIQAVVSDRVDGLVQSVDGAVDWSAVRLVG